ncbi:O-antigen ligase family protein [Membranihabitans marinus]|uniref:O-antigen ligase family protein n=1 Tax=Membranihabitans marinus TaxID=1227546 RepID=UPI001F3637B3|nr:O-antigen ligase family protein [Membranihabitans marinus]
MENKINISNTEILSILGLSGLSVFLALYIEAAYVLSVVFIPIFIYAIFFKTETLWWLTIFMTPLSINLESFMDSELGISLPTEIILAIFLILTPIHFILNPPKKQFLLHPISLLTAAYIIWTFITALTSVQIVVSLKNTIAQLWFIVPIYYLGHQWLQPVHKRRQFLHLFSLSFALVVAYTFVNLYINDFPEKASQWLMNPFFKDHTILGAALGITTPYITLMAFEKNTSRLKLVTRYILVVLFITVLIFTYSRAAILSLFAAFVVYLFIRLKISIQSIIKMALLACIMIGLNWSTVIDKLSQNQAESSGEVLENIESISNISTDASNVERINRWNSALKMWQAKPIFGWGPGTYQFQYAPFQNSKDMTIISTNVGDVGNAHSEFLGMLAESGLPGAVIKLCWVLAVFYYGYIHALRLQGEPKLILLSGLLGFVAYFTHGILNNFMIYDKAAVPLWAIAAIIVSFDLQSTPKQKEI